MIYTSGTTGRPKGCVLTHGNFMFELGVATEELADLFGEDASTLLFLPLAHVFARIIQIGCVKTRTPMGHSSDISHLTADLSEFRPTFVLAVPRVFEKVFTTASQRATADGRGKVFDRAAAAAIAWSQVVERGADPRGDSGPATRPSPGWSTAGSGTPSGAGARTRSPVAPRWGTAWATSSEGSGSRSSRATG